jgi:hypothetical protein
MVALGGAVGLRRNWPYKPGELEVVLSLAPTNQNIRWLATLLERSEDAIQIIYKQAFEYGPFGKTAKIQEKKILAAKKRVGIAIGRRKRRLRAKK